MNVNPGPDATTVSIETFMRFDKNPKIANTTVPNFKSTLISYDIIDKVDLNSFLPANIAVMKLVSDTNTASK